MYFVTFLRYIFSGPAFTLGAESIKVKEKNEKNDSISVTVRKFFSAKNNSEELVNETLS